MKQYDFTGWATRYNVRCTDGRIIRCSAFKDCDGLSVPLVWNHNHSDPDNVLGSALLKHCDSGIYAYCSFNDTEKAITAKKSVIHGDITSLSIYANHLLQKGSEVKHGNIREVSLVLAGANPGAFIDSVICHGEESSDEAIIYSGVEGFEGLAHSETSGTDDSIDDSEVEEKIKKLYATFTQNQKRVFDLMLAEQKKQGATTEFYRSLTPEQQSAVTLLLDRARVDSGLQVVIHADTDESNEKESKSKEDNMNGKNETEASEAKKSKAKDKTVQDVFNSLTDEQKTAVYFIIGKAIEDAKNEANDDEDEEDNNVKHNAFEKVGVNSGNVPTFSQEEFNDIIDSAKRNGSLKDSFLRHSIDNVEFLFPDDAIVGNAPGIIARPAEWADAFLKAVKHSPVSRVKSLEANLTEADARARGYIKGNRKKEQVFKLLKRSTQPHTVVKLQKVDRDDIVDITDFDIIGWIKKEMRVLLDEEIARAALIGDGRDASSEDKIDEINIRPIWKDADLYAVKALTTISDTATDDERGRAFIKAAIKARSEYRGSGKPTLYTTEEMLTTMLLIEDGIGRRLYETEEKLATALRVKEIVTVAPMIGQWRIGGDGITRYLDGIIVNPIDYMIGADKGGSVNLFDDFDIDFNKYTYMIETRCSGAMIKPFGAIVLEHTTNSGTATPVTTVSGLAEGLESARAAGMMGTNSTSTNSTPTDDEEPQG